MLIYDCPGFPNPLRVRIAAAEKKMTDRITFVSIDVPGGEHRTPAFLAKNPAGVVPVLELSDGTIIAECSAITEYLDHLDGNPELTGGTAHERAVIHMMQRRAEAGLLDAVGTYFHHATTGLGPALELYQNAEWGERAAVRAVEGMRFLDDILKTRRYIAGDRFSVADITAIAGLVFADFAGVDVPPDLSRLRKWRNDVTVRPAVRSAMGN